MIGCDWLKALEKKLLQSYRADDGRTVCVSTINYGESLWFHLFHIHEPNGARCNIHGQIRRSKHHCDEDRNGDCIGTHKPHFHFKRGQFFLAHQTALVLLLALTNPTLGSLLN